MNGKRDEIVAAARAVFAESGAGAISVRAVAARAGIGASTLRHYFPTQQDLRDAVFAAAFDDALGDLRIHDASIPPRQRLAECVTQFMPHIEALDTAIEGWFELVSSIVGARASQEMRAAWSYMVRRAQVRTMCWLEVLEAEGALRPGTPERHARMLLALVDGVALSMLIPETRPTHAEMRETLDDAVAAIVLGEDER